MMRGVGIANPIAYARLPPQSTRGGSNETMNRRHTRPLTAVAVGFALALTAVPGSADETTPAGATPKITISGFLDWYYQYSFSHPASGTNLPGRAFDIRNDSFTLNQLEVSIARPTTDQSPVGFTATLTAGKTADLVHLYEPGGAVTHAFYNDTPTRFLQQLYGTYLIRGKSPVTIDFGKFVTHMGYEVIESWANDNFSRSLLFTYAIPLYHTGLRFTVPMSKELTAQLLLVNGWNSVEDDNSSKSIGMQLNYKPNDRLNVILNYMGGNEGGKALGNGVFSGIGFPDDHVRNVQVVDLVAVANPTPKLKVGLNVDYGGAFAAGDSGTWSGQAYYARYQITPSTALALRYDRLQDTGLRLGADTQISALTATLEYTVKGSLVNRLEFRHDQSGNAGAFGFPGGGGVGRRQDTVTFAQVYKF